MLLTSGDTKMTIENNLTSEPMLPSPTPFLPWTRKPESLREAERLFLWGSGPENGTSPLQPLPISTGPPWPVSNSLQRLLSAATQTGNDWEPLSHPEDPLSPLHAGDPLTFISPLDRARLSKSGHWGEWAWGRGGYLRTWGLPELSSIALPAQRGPGWQLDFKLHMKSTLQCCQVQGGWGECFKVKL